MIKIIKKSLNLKAKYIDIRSISSNKLNIFDWPSYDKGIENASTPPSSWYTDSRFLKEVEEKNTFKSWLMIGRKEKLENPGDYWAATFMNQPVIIIKGENGDFRAYYNVCRHHAAQICDEGFGHLDLHERFTCPYHGWEYSREGKLTKAVAMKGCLGFNPKEFSLKSIPIQIVGPWIYLNLFPGAPLNRLMFDDQPDIKTMFELLEKTNYDKLKFIASRRYVLNCNWKIFIDNYLDGGYHVPFAHISLTTNLNLSKYQRIGYENFFLQTCPAQTSTSLEAEIKDRISGGEKGSETVYVYQYPNICINRYGKWMDTNIVWPIGPNQCEVLFDWFVDESIIHEKDFIQKCIDQSHVVQQEDIYLCDRVQKGVQSDGYEVGRYAPTLEGIFFIWISNFKYMSLFLIYF